MPRQTVEEFTLLVAEKPSPATLCHPLPEEEGTE